MRFSELVSNCGSKFEGLRFSVEQAKTSIGDDAFALVQDVGALREDPKPYSHVLLFRGGSSLSLIGEVGSDSNDIISFGKYSGGLCWFQDARGN
eukprot:2202581-Amphidinium_carterae.1